MTNNELRVFQLVQDITGYFYKNIEEVSIDDDLRELFGLDSLDEIELILALESEYHVDIPEDVAVDLNTIRKVVTFLTESGAYKEEASDSGTSLHILIYPSSLHVSGLAAGVFTDKNEAEHMASKVNGVVRTVPGL